MTTAMRGAAVWGEGLQADHDVLLGYQPDRVTRTQLLLGSGARLRSGTVLYAGSRIGDRFATGHHVVVREECDIGDDVSIWSNTVVDYSCEVGDRVKIHCNCYIAQYSRLRDDVFLAPGVTLANDLYPGNATSAALMCGPTLEKGAQLGVNVTVLPYVTIGSGAIIGAGAVVTQDIPAGTVAVGSPARVVREVRALPDIAERVGARVSSIRGARER